MMPIWKKKCPAKIVYLANKNSISVYLEIIGSSETNRYLNTDVRKLRQTETYKREFVKSFPRLSFVNKSAFYNISTVFQRSK